MTSYSRSTVITVVCSVVFEILDFENEK